MKVICVSAVAAALMLATPALAGPIPDGGVTAAEVAAVMLSKGFKAEITKDSDGDPMIISGVDGTTFRVLFYGCKPTKRCMAIQFASGFDLKTGLSLQQINNWNRNNRFGRGYLDDDMDPIVHMDVDLEHGATTEAVANVLATWSSVVPAFKAFMRE